MHNKPRHGIELISMIGLKMVFVFTIMDIIFITAIRVQTITSPSMRVGIPFFAAAELVPPIGSHRLAVGDVLKL